MTAKKFISRVAIVCLAIAALWLNTGCTTNKAATRSDIADKASLHESQAPLGSPSMGACGDAPHQPVLLGVAQDKTGSAQSNPTPQLKTTNLSPLYGLLRCRGGELAFVVITSSSSQNLLRLRVEERPHVPAKPNNPNPFLQQEDMSVYKKKKDSYDNDLHDWEEKTQKAIQTFEEQIQPLLKLPASANRTDFFGALQELELFEREPRLGWDGRARRFLLVVSDGDDNVRKSVPSLPAGTQFLLVFGGEIPQSVNALHPIRFESVESAVRYIVSVKEQ